LSLERLAAAERENERAARESVHRIKNLIAVTGAIADKIADEVSSVKEFDEVLRLRLEALGLAQEVLVRRNWSDVDLQDVIKSTLGPFLPNPGLRIEPGPDVMVPAAYVRGLGMALYELCTNSTKYGALAGGRGPARITWALDANENVLTWDEKPPSAPRNETSGFGSLLIRMAFSGEPGTSVRYIVEAAQVRATFSWPAGSELSAA
jgi:two-component sensor histidine kinase